MLEEQPRELGGRAGGGVHDVVRDRLAFVGQHEPHLAAEDARGGLHVMLQAVVVGVPFVGEERGQHGRVELLRRGQQREQQPRVVIAQAREAAQEEQTALHALEAVHRHKEEVVAAGCDERLACGLHRKAGADKGGEAAVRHPHQLAIVGGQHLHDRDVDQLGVAEGAHDALDPRWIRQAVVAQKRK